MPSPRHRFPAKPPRPVFNHLIRKDVVLNVQQEHNLQTLFALIGAMKEFFTSKLATRSGSSKLGDERHDRIEKVRTEVKRLNAKLTSMLDYHRTTDEIDAFFDGLFSSKWLDDYSEAQDDLLKLFEKGRSEIQLKPYVRMLRAANDSLEFFKSTKAYGKKIYACLKDEPIMDDVTDADTIQAYWSKQGYGVNTDYNWEQAIKLVDAVKKEYTKA